MKRYIKSAVSDILSEPEEIKREVARNIDTPAATLMRLTEDMDPYVRKDVAENRSAPYSALKCLSRDPDYMVRETVATSLHTPEPILLKMASSDKSLDLRYTALRNQCISESKLTELATSSDWRTREAVAMNMNTPIDVLVQLSKDPHWVVKRGVASNLNTPSDCLADLSKSDNLYISSKAYDTMKGRARLGLN